MSTENVVTLDAFKQEFPEVIKQGVADGHLEFEATEVSAKDTETDKVGKMTYQRVVAKTLDGSLILAGGSQEELLKMVTAQFDAATRANVRNAILREIEGPDKTLRQIAVKIAKKYNKNEDEVFASIKANPELVGLLS